MRPRCPLRDGGGARSDSRRRGPQTVRRYAASSELARNMGRPAINEDGDAMIVGDVAGGDAANVDRVDAGHIAKVEDEPQGADFAYGIHQSLLKLDGLVGPDTSMGLQNEAAVRKGVDLY